MIFRERKPSTKAVSLAKTIVANGSHLPRNRDQKREGPGPLVGARPSNSSRDLRSDQCGVPTGAQRCSTWVSVRCSALFLLDVLLNLAADERARGGAGRRRQIVIADVLAEAPPTTAPIAVPAIACSSFGSSCTVTSSSQHSSAGAAGAAAGRGALCGRGAGVA